MSNLDERACCGVVGLGLIRAVRIRHSPAVRGDLNARPAALHCGKD
jgi:hypothetical protein